MIVLFKGMKHRHIFVSDIEYDGNRVVQFAGLLFQNIDKQNSLYQIHSSINVFLKQPPLGNYTKKYTGLSDAILSDVGLKEEDFIQSYRMLFNDIDMTDTLFVSHGSKNDRKILKMISGIELPKHSFCTYRNAKRILNREEKLTLTDVAKESGYFLDNAHDAFADAWATVAVLSFLTKIDNEQGE
jgi:DNA polymerase III epsilon subunit-like protein